MHNEITDELAELREQINKEESFRCQIMLLKCYGILLSNKYKKAGVMYFE